MLGFLNSNGSGGENLDTSQLTELKHVSCFHFHASFSDSALAQDFSLFVGNVTVTVPQVTPNNNYIVARAYIMVFRCSSA